MYIIIVRDPRDMYSGIYLSFKDQLTSVIALHHILCLQSVGQSPDWQSAAAVSDNTGVQSLTRQLHSRHQAAASAVYRTVYCRTVGGRK